MSNNRIAAISKMLLEMGLSLTEEGTREDESIITACGSILATISMSMDNEEELWYLNRTCDMINAHRIMMSNPAMEDPDFLNKIIKRLKDGLE